MQSSHRNFLAASIGAVAILGPADVALAQSVHTPSTASSRLSNIDNTMTQAFNGSESGDHFFWTTEAFDAEEFVWRSQDNNSHVSSATSSASMAETILNTYGVTPPSTTSTHTDTEFASGDSLQHNTDIPQHSSPLDSTPQTSTAPEPTLPDNSLELRDPEGSADRLDIDSRLAQEPPLEEVETTDDAFEPLDDNGLNLEDAVESQEPEQGSEPEQSDDIDLRDDNEGAEVIEFDGSISTEADALLAPAPEYLNSDPNPLSFPTDPDEVDVEGIQPITLDQALELARRNSRELQSALIQLERAQAALREAQAQRIPTLTVSSDITHQDLNPASEPTDFLGNPIEQDNNTTTLNGAVQIDYDLFTSGFRNATIRAAERAVRLQELQIEVVTEELRLNTTNAYYDLQETDEQVRIAEADLEEALISLRDAEARERAGVGTRFDRLQAEVEVANSQQGLRNAISAQEIARRQLAELLSLPSGVNISAADEVEVAGVWPLTLEESIVEAFKNRAEPEQQLVQRELDQQQRRAEAAQVLPQLSLFARYRFSDLLDETRASNDVEALEVGAQFQWLLYDGGAARARARQEEADIRLAEVNFADTLETIRFDVEEAFSQLGANFENIQTAATAVEVAQESLRLARLRFQAGVGIQSDVITAQSDLTDAELNLVTAILGYNRALVAIQRAVSNLDANLGDVP